MKSNFGLAVAIIGFSMLIWLIVAGMSASFKGYETINEALISEGRNSFVLFISCVAVAGTIVIGIKYTDPPC